MKTTGWLAGLAVAVWLAGAAWAGEPTEATLPERPIRVGVMVAPPFVEKDVDGHYSGLALDLWRDVAHDLERPWQVAEYDLPGLLTAVRQGTVDVGVSALSITPDREAAMDFSQPFHYTGLGIAVPAKARHGFVLLLLEKIFSLHVLLYVGSLVALLLAMGCLVWLVERRRNPNHFRPGRQGIGDGLWWSAVTMTSVGYGDAIPKTVAGRGLALVWMFASVALLTFFTAGITSSLTVESLGDTVRSIDDLHKVRTGVKRGSAAEEELIASHVGVDAYDSVEQGLRAVAAGEIDAFVHDKPILHYYQHRSYHGRVRVLPFFFNPQLYGFAFPRDSALRKVVNVAMLRRLEDREYRVRLMGPYLGKEGIH